MKNMPDSIQWSEGRGGLRRVQISSRLAEAEIYLHGAHITHFQPRGRRPVLFMSGKSWFERDKPIRGGVPVCFPWFGPRPGGLPGLPHGYARLSEWRLTDVREAADGSVDLSFEFNSENVAPEWLLAGTIVRFDVGIGHELRMALTVRNDSAAPVRFEEALHTYLAVSDARNIGIEGLAGATCLDRLAPGQERTEGGEAIRIVAETDRLYVGTQATCVVHDPGWNRRIVVAKTGSNTTVVWNPWVAKAKAMPDFGDDEWPGMVCVETCNAGPNSVTLAAGETHEMTALLRVE